MCRHEEAKAGVVAIGRMRGALPPPPSLLSPLLVFTCFLVLRCAPVYTPLHTLPFLKHKLPFLHTLLTCECEFGLWRSRAERTYTRTSQRAIPGAGNALSLLCCPLDP